MGAAGVSLSEHQRFTMNGSPRNTGKVPGASLGEDKYFLSFA